MDLVLTANSPGELLGWVAPIVNAFRKQETQSRIFLFLLPCAYATGKEFEVASHIKGIDCIFSPFDYIIYMVFGYLPGGIKFSSYGAVFHLGGDVFHSAILSKRLSFPAFAYLWGNKRWDKYFKKYFVPDNRQSKLLQNRGIDGQKINIVGNLLADTIDLSELEEETGQQSSAKVLQPLLRRDLRRICFLPGSRQHEVRFIVPFFLAVAELLKEKMENVEFVMPLSPFVEINQLVKLLRKKPWHNFDGSTGVIRENKDGWVIDTQNGAQIQVRKGQQYKAMKQSDLVVSIPGTKCGEAGYLGRPMLVILPTNKPEELPSVGLIGWLRWLPLIGPLLKRTIILWRLRNWNAYVAQPNILAGEEIVPEIKGIITASAVAEAILNLLRNPNQLMEMSKKLSIVYKGESEEKRKRPGDRIVEEILMVSKTVV